MYSSRSVFQNRYAVDSEPPAPDRSKRPIKDSHAATFTGDVNDEFVLYEVPAEADEPPQPSRPCEPRPAPKMPVNQGHEPKLSVIRESVNSEAIDSIRADSATGARQDFPAQWPLAASSSIQGGDVASVSQQTVKRDESVHPDFFGPGIFQAVLANPATAHQLRKYAQQHSGVEKINFLSKVDELRKILTALKTTIHDMETTFLDSTSHQQVGLPTSTHRATCNVLSQAMTDSLPAIEATFQEPQATVENNIFNGIYPPFVRAQMTRAATRALVGDRTRYQGLGDCFCMTNPRKADNPIEFASDGFVSVTGYQRKEVIPRNCRFLQGPQTDRLPVRRLKQAIEGRDEAIELLLNYKKNGEPFWNLLYVAPLKNVRGETVFFLGGQINCSTTIHSNADVMRALSYSDEPSDSVSLNSSNLLHRPSSSHRKRSLLKAFSSKETATVASETGIEQGLISKLEGVDLHAQISQFYSAYSKYVVMAYDTMIVHFSSPEVIELFVPNALGGATNIYGVDIFKFLKLQMLAGKSIEIKSPVRSALKKKLPVSVEMHLQTRRSALFRGDEKFITHWTPLKDENGEVRWVIACLCPLLS